MDYSDKILSAKIMIVDDDPLSVMLMEETLAEAGYTSLTSCEDPREAVGVFIDKEPDIILLDINMPHLTGYDVLNLIREAEPDRFIPVIVLTSQADNQARLKALELGAMDFITKPFEKAEILTRIRNMLTVRLLQKRVENENIRLEEKVRERTKELQETQHEIIKRLARAAEFRDDDTGAHIERMSKMCALLGRAAGMSDREADNLLNAAPMHDVGKIGIPDAILLKPGKFTDEEFEKMKAHSVIGAKLLDGHNSELMRMARDIALTHHERWDGSGYPSGMKGEEIPIEGRIASLCDVYDALTSSRPYKKAWTSEEAVAEIEKNKGSQFDPGLVDVFVSIIDQINDIKVEYFSEPDVESKQLFTTKPLGAES